MSQIQVYGGGGGGSSSVLTLTGNSGGAVPPTAGNINVVGSGGITVTGNPGTSTLTITDSGSGFTWTNVTAATQAMAVDNGYVADRATLITFTLPATAALGDTMKIIGKNTGLYTIAQNAGQSINFVSSSTTVGVGGSLTAIDQFATIELVCTVADTTFTVDASMGNFTVV